MIWALLHHTAHGCARLDGAEGAHGHEDGRLYGAVVGSQETGARITAGIGVLQLEKSAFGAPSGAE